MNTLKRAAELLRQDASAIWQLTKLSGTDDRINEMVLVAAQLERMAQPGRIDGVDSNPPGLLRFFAYDDEVGFERFNTEAEAKKFVQESIDEYRAIAAEGWPEEVENLCWGVVLGTTKQVPVPDDGYDGSQGVADSGPFVDYVLTNYTHPAPVNQQMLEAPKELRDAYQEFMGVPAVKANAAIAAAEASGQENHQAEPVAWIPASTPPQIDIGEAEHCWVTVKSKRNGTEWVWDVYYCNLPILECDDDPHWAIYDESGERVSMIGWAEKGAHPDFCYFYSKLDLELHDVIAWQPVRRPVAYHEGGAA
ncbi:hypothetical protein [Laribacter hongkongensis]|uniref:hypothetical protein n=1 Tax=Laribacter hongkongensis TaxID=168471 RepID=UPI001EFE5310|nr:hypothetical protein [Laribacter hongkongensis]MCG9078965.1 hypothetical protein [Laribacter hongkongensis]